MLHLALVKLRDSTNDLLEVCRTPYAARFQITLVASTVRNCDFFPKRHDGFRNNTDSCCRGEERTGEC